MAIQLPAVHPNLSKMGNSWDYRSHILPPKQNRLVLHRTDPLVRREASEGVDDELLTAARRWLTSKKCLTEPSSVIMLQLLVPHSDIMLPHRFTGSSTGKPISQGFNCDISKITGKPPTCRPTPWHQGIIH